MPTYRGRYGKGIIVLVVELVMIMGIPLKSVSMLLNIRIQTVLDWFWKGCYWIGRGMMVKRRLEGLVEH